MMILLFWLMALLLFALATRLGQAFGVTPIVSQLMLATFGLPLLMVFWIKPQRQISGAEHYQNNALIFGVGDLFCMTGLKLLLQLPMKAEAFRRLQNYLAISPILTFVKTAEQAREPLCQ